MNFCILGHGILCCQMLLMIFDKISSQLKISQLTHNSFFATQACMVIGHFFYIFMLILDEAPDGPAFS